TGLLVGAVSERFIVRPIARTSQLNAIIVTLGLLLVIQGTVGMIWGNEQHGFQYAFSYVGRFSPASVFAVAAVAGVALLLFLLYRFTPLGLGMRAAAHHPEAAGLGGVRVALMLTIGGPSRPSSVRSPGCSPDHRSSHRTCSTSCSSSGSPQRSSVGSTTRSVRSSGGCSSASACPTCPDTSAPNSPPWRHW